MNKYIKKYIVPMCAWAYHVGAQMIEQIMLDTETTENADADKDVEATPLAAFWTEHRLLHK